MDMPKPLPLIRIGITHSFLIIMNMFYYLQKTTSLLVLFFLILTNTNTFGQLPDNFYDEPFTSDWDRAVGFTFDQSGRMYVWEKPGKVYIIEQDGTKLQEPFIDISEEVADWGDHGLLGFALHPNFLINGYVYLFYVVDPHHLLYYGTPEYSASESIEKQATIGRITRYTADVSTNYTSIIPSSRFVLLGDTITNGVPIMHDSHSCNTLLFGNDGTLLASCGDGSTFEGIYTGGGQIGTYAPQGVALGILKAHEDVGPFRSQLNSSYSGKILRIDPLTGDGLSSNPFYNEENPRSAQSRVWALGLRNPFRMVIKPGTGAHYPAEGDPGIIYVGDVGGAQGEEINIVTEGGQNFGWPIYEGYTNNWGYGSTYVYNLQAPNPLFGISGCDREYFYFQDLLINPNINNEPSFGNPCDWSFTVPENIATYTLSLPLIVWSNALWNPPHRALVGIYNEEGFPSFVDIEDPDSPVQGENFAGVSSIAGVFYNGDSFPEYYKGKFFNADYHGWIKLFDINENNELISVEPFHDNTPEVVHFAMNPNDDCMYYITYETHEIRKICYGGNPRPIAIADYDINYGTSPLQVQFDGSSSYHPAGLPISYLWDFGDGTTSSEMNPQHTFFSSNDDINTFTVLLTVTDSLGLSRTDEKIVSVNNTPPQVEITSFNNGEYFPVFGNTLLPLIANVHDEEHPNEVLAYKWQVSLFHNEHNHPEAPDFNPVTEALLSPVGCLGEIFFYRIELEVSDPSGLSTTVFGDLFPYCEDDFIRFNNVMATQSDEVFDITFDTEFEIGVTDLIIERRLENDETFMPIGLIDNVVGNSQSVQSYHFTDNIPEYGSIKYRIRAKNETNAFVYSFVAEVDYRDAETVTIFPNPVYSVINIVAPFTDNQNATTALTLYDITGRRVLDVEWPSYLEPDKQISIADLPPGTYLYKVTGSTFSKKGKIIKR